MIAKWRIFNIAAILFSLLLGGCSGYLFSNYHAYNGTVGYSELSLGSDKLEVTYVGPEHYNAIQAKKLALRRAAEIASQRGFSYLAVLESTIDRINEQEVIEGKTRIVEEQDSSGGTKVIYIEEIPEWTYNKQRISITLFCQLSHQYRDDSFKVHDLLPENKK